MLAGEFDVTLTGMSGGFSFRISAQGSFTVDWGDGTAPQIITKIYVQDNTYSHTYTTVGNYVVEISGDATGYSTAKDVAVISFASSTNKTKITKIDGSLGAIFPTIGDGSANGAQPRFYQTFLNCTGLTGAIPSGLFSGINGAPASNMFYNTFYGCSGLTGAIPAGLFSGINGAPASNMFASTFNGCSGLTGAIPNGLFGTFTGITAGNMFGNTFYGCSGITTIEDGIWDLSGLTNGTLGINTSYMFNSTFYGMTSLTSAAPTIAAGNPTNLWEHFTAYTGQNAFAGNTNMANYPCIPTAWGGGGQSCLTVTLVQTPGSGGTVSVSVANSATMPTITIPSAANMVFLGYFDNPTGGVQYYTNTGTSARNYDKTTNTTLYAQWGCGTGYKKSADGTKCVCAEGYLSENNNICKPSNCIGSGQQYDSCPGGDVTAVCTNGLGGAWGIGGLGPWCNCNVAGMEPDGNTGNCRCKAGYYKDGNKCTSCGNNRYCPLGATAPQTCPPNNQDLATLSGGTILSQTQGWTSQQPNSSRITQCFGDTYISVDSGHYLAECSWNGTNYYDNCNTTNYLWYWCNVGYYLKGYRWTSGEAWYSGCSACTNSIPANSHYSTAGTADGNNCQYECNNGYNLSNGTCLAICPYTDMTTLRIGNFSFPLYVAKNTEHAVAVGYDGNVCYANLTPGNGAGLNVNINGTTWHTIQ